MVKGHVTVFLFEMDQEWVRCSSGAQGCLLQDCLGSLSWQRTLTLAFIVG